MNREDTEKLGILNFKPNYNITFHRGNDKVGTLDFNGPEMTFSGDMDESANWTALTKKINGGTIGLEDRIKHINHALEVLTA